MNNSIESLFEEVYRLKNSGREIQFLSDWDSNLEEHNGYNTIIKDVYTAAADSTTNYVFSYEQFDVKNLVTSTFASELQLTLPEESITITPNSTLSVFLTLKALRALGVNRVLVLTPCYFSLLSSLKDAGFDITYFHLVDDEAFYIDSERLKLMVKEQYIECIIITDPIYSAGIELSIGLYEELRIMAQTMDTYIVVDYSLGGLKWNDLQILGSKEKLEILSKCPKFAFIDSLPKRLLLNGIKFSIIFGSIELIDKIDRLAETIYGALSSAQLELVRQLYSTANHSTLTEYSLNNIARISSNYRLVKNYLKDTSFDIYLSNTGFFSIVYSRSIKLREVDTEKFATNLLTQKGILAITSDRLSYFNQNRFGVRVNLTKRADDLISSISEIIRVPANAFN